MGKNSRPGEIRSTHEDFLLDSKVQSEIWRVFGKDTLEYAKGVCSGQLNYLQYLPKPILVRVMSFLELEDVSRFACTCRKFRELSDSEELWEELYQKNLLVHSASQHLHMDELRALAKDIGWKRLYFTNRIQLQRLLNRLRERTQSAQQAAMPKIPLAVSQSGNENGVEKDKDKDKSASDVQNDVESVRWPSARPLVTEPVSRLEMAKKAQSAAFPERAETILANLPPEVRFLENLGPAIERPAPQLDDAIEEQAERPAVDERTKQERIKAWLKEAGLPGA